LSATFGLIIISAKAFQQIKFIKAHSVRIIMRNNVWGTPLLGKKYFGKMISVKMI
jgi:hypothetical protein